MFIAVTTIKTPGAPLDHIAEAFRTGALELKQFEGFLGFELWRSEDTLKAVSRWSSRQAMEAYAQSERFQAHHGPGTRTPDQGSGQVEHYEAEVVV